jgi:hypothetical protein
MLPTMVGGSSNGVSCCYYLEIMIYEFLLLQAGICYISVLFLLQLIYRVATLVLKFATMSPTMTRVSSEIGFCYICIIFFR